MRRLVLTQFGPPAESIELREQPGEPDVGPGEVLVEIAAAPTSPSDLPLITGRYPVRPELPFALGLEGAGRVLAAGSAEHHDLVGRQVVFLPNYEQGTWADKVVVSAANVLAVNEAADPLQLSMIASNGITAYGLLSGYADLQPGDWIGQNAGNSAIGRYVIALARRAGVKTLSLVRSDAAARQVTAAGGDAVVVIGEETDAAIADALGGSRLALALDATGGPDVDALAHALAAGASVVSFARASGQAATVSIPDLIFRDVRYRGFWLISWLQRTPRPQVHAVLRELADLVAGGELVAEIERTYPLDRFREALEHTVRPGKQGKLLFTP
jgi:NADPH:quinone reductase-like Zn-dependent oxidoreductase